MSRSVWGRSKVAAAVLVALVLTGCAGGDSASETAGQGGGSSGAGGAAEPATGGAAAQKGGADAGAAAGSRVDAAAVDPAALSRRLVRTGDLSMRVDDVPATVARVRSLVTTAKGVVTDEKTHTQPAGVDEGNGELTSANTESALTVRVPEKALDKVMADVGRLGTVLARSQTSTDVTSQYVDTASRVRTQRESVDRVRALLGQAKTIGQVVQVESELARRQADLEALQARLAALEDTTTLATLVVNIATRDAATTVAPNAFVQGMRSGWHALVTSAGVALTIAGALLPFAVLLALVGGPVLYLALRRRRTRPVPPAPAAT